MTARDLAAYLFLALAWGLSFLLITLVVEAFGISGAVTLRALVAGASLIVFARLSARRLDFSAGLQPFAVVGLTTVALQLIGLSYGTPRTGTAMAAIIIATIPLFSMLMGRLAGIERLTGSAATGLGFGFLGIVLLVGFPAVPVTADFIAGCAALLMACVAAAAGSLYASHRMKGVGALETTAGAFLLGRAMTLPLLIIAPLPGWPRAIDVLYLVILGAGMSALTYALYFGLVARIGATRAVSVEFAVTAVAVFVGAVLLDEPLSTMQIAGAVIITLGCALVLGLIGPAERSPPPQ